MWNEEIASRTQHTAKTEDKDANEHPEKKNKQIQATANRGGKKTREIRNAHNNCVTVATICKMLNIPCPHPNNMNAFMPRRHFSFATTKRTSLT